MTAQDLVAETQTVDPDVKAQAEELRLAALERYEILDTPPDGAFDRITAIAARLFSCPIAIVSLVDHDRIWFKSHHGLDVEQIAREPGLCASAIFHDHPWILTDAKADPRALTNSLVAGEFGLRFYAGVPLRTSDGHNLGTLCVIDREPRQVTPEQIGQLDDLASLVMAQMDLRLAARNAIDHLAHEMAERERSEAALRDSDAFSQRLLASSSDCIKVLDLEGRLLSMSDGGKQGLEIEDVAPFIGTSWIDFFEDSDQSAARTAVAVAAAGGSDEFEGCVPKTTGEPRWWSSVVTAITNRDGAPEKLLVISRDITGRRQTEANLRAADAALARHLADESARLRYLFEQAPGFIAVLRGRDHVFELANAAYLKIVGHRDLLGKSVRQALPELEGQSFFELLDKVFRSGEPFSGRNLPAVLQDPLDGEVHRFVDFIYQPITDRTGEVTGIFVEGYDVTDRAIAEAALVDSQDKFHGLAENIPTLCWMAEPNGDIFWYNRRWYDYTGTTPDDQQGWGWGAAHDPDVLPSVLERWKASIATGEPFEMVFPLKGADGAFRPFLTRIVPMRNDVGEIVRWFGTNTDVTELQTLRRTEALYHLIVENAVEFAIITTNLERHITSWNEGACNLFGYRSEEVIGRPVDLIFTPEDRTEGQPDVEMERALKEGRAVNERLLVRRDGARFWANELMTPMHDRDGGQPIGLLIIAQDHTEQRQHEEHMGLMVNELNHRVKNSLATVQAIASQTLGSATSLSQAKLDFTTRLIALAEAHDVLTRESWEGANLDDMVTAAIRPFRVAEASRFSISGPHVRLSPKTTLALALAFHELCTNAAKYGALSNDAGTITINWSFETDGRLRLVWSERGGPPVTPPERKSFGSRLIRMALAGERDGETTMSFEPEGVVCVFRAQFPGVISDE